MKLLIGIDPGAKNGFAVWNGKELTHIHTLLTFQVFEQIELHLEFPPHRVHPSEIHIYIENPHTWKPFRGVKMDSARLQGVGQVKARYNSIIEFLEAKKIPFTPVNLQGTMKKIKADYFKKLTGYTGQTNEHGRDAAMIVYGRKLPL